MEEVALHVDGTRIYGRRWRPEKRARGGVLLLHGFNASIGEFGDLGETLAAAGFHVLAIDQRGHGLSGGERGRINLDRCLADVQAAVDDLRAGLGRKARLALVGHSLGGALAVGIASRTSWFSCLVLAQPVDRVLDETPLPVRGVYHIIGKFGHWRLRRGKSAGMLPRPPAYKFLYKSREAAKKAAAEPYLNPRANVANYSFFATMQASEWAQRVKVPSLCIWSKDDRRVKAAHSKAVFRALAGPIETLEHEGGHACFRDLDKDKVAAGIVAFLRQRLA